MNWKDLRHRLEFFGLKLVGCLMGMMSVRQTVWFADCFGWLMTRVLPKKLTRYHVAYDNIQTAFPGQYSPAETEQLICKMWVHLFRMIAEMFQFPRKLCRENMREVLRFRNRSQVVQALCTGRPVFMLGGHYGNWESTILAFGLFDLPMGVIGRELDNPYIHQWVKEGRERTGHKLMLKQGGWDDMTALLSAGGNMGLLCDQDAGKRGVFVDFFGRPASTFKSIALMAIEYNALIVMGYGIRLEDDPQDGRWARFEIGCEDIIDVNEIEADNVIHEITQRYTTALERAIRRAPEQYFWVHRRWKTEPKQRKKALQDAA
ncbi:MAG: lysophospholipid acyltransferase family protein [Planctomycetaceae bacterium]|nr:lysophospholipid acyltransferase family protein [Planctomycetaceae bacterium]MCB9953981.1 lysophospholipid acyltransferase family protein [Planctomycetaceae bacterium]